MKLNPPASSSDLDVAREIARRLHQRRRRADLERLDARRASAASSGTFAAREPHGNAPPSTAASPVDVGGKDEPAPPSWEDDEPHRPRSIEEHLAGALDDLGGESAEGPPPSSNPENPLADAAPSAGLEEGSVSPDELIGEGPPSDPSDVGTSGPFDGPLAGSELDVPTVGEPNETEELFDEPPPPSWDDVVETCRDIARASGAMIIDPAGQVFAARGEWPDPGADAIAGRLVTMMERTLKDAPTRSVSAPVGEQHLTAWRVLLAEGLVTAALIADSPLRSEVRSAIDAEIHRGAGA
jgi:hypothetical protein